MERHASRIFLLSSVIKMFKVYHLHMFIGFEFLGLIHNQSLLLTLLCVLCDTVKVYKYKLVF
ncbi:hypothetical protein HanIR_Chr01g0045791 [Helianthus annuus]|nr:hypothetical protein HanIR_Chr01g0045791 [Helianthus annuus]